MTMPARHIPTRPGTTRPDWLIPAGLIVLGMVPMIAGSARLFELASGGAITPDNARFFAAPLPVVLHVVGLLVFCPLGALQFSKTLRRRQPGRHRFAGRFVAPAGIITALSGLWMTLFYPLPAHDSAALNAVRLLVGVAMATSLILGYLAVRRRDIPAHSAWMLRGYALGLGAGTQVLTHLPWFILVGDIGPNSKAVLMTLGWAISVAVAELVIRRRATSKARAVSGGS